MRPGPVYLTVLVIATCGLVYELIAGTLASYVLGDSVTQFSTVIGAYLSAMGLGSYLSRYVRRGLVRTFVEVELAVALLGGLSAPLLFLAFGHLPHLFRPVLYSVVLLVGTLVGIEIPLILRILKEQVDFRDLVAKVLTFDYLGALAASLLFPIVLVPSLGLVRTSLLLGLANAAVGLWSTWLFAAQLRTAGILRGVGAFVVLVLTVGFAYGDRLTELAEEELYADPVVFATSSRHQRIVLTRSRDHFQLFLNGNLQFSSTDEYRYHEALVHPAMALAPEDAARRALVVGGGDGLAVRELLKHPGLAEVVLVDLDPEMTRLAAQNPFLKQLNGEALLSPKVKVVNDDALVWLAQGDDAFDVVIADFPDPHNFSLGKLYTRRFYALVKRRLTPDGVLAVQATSPLMARRSFWCIVRTIEAAGFHVRPYHAPVPSFGEWGFALASPRRFDPPTSVIGGLRYLDGPTLATLFVFGPDLAPVPTDVNLLNNQALVGYYEDEWRRWN
jgi:spermidine synthase